MKAMNKEFTPKDLEFWRNREVYYEIEFESAMEAGVEYMQYLIKNRVDFKVWYESKYLVVKSE